VKKPRAYTKQEVRDMLIGHIKGIAKYWADETRTPDVLDKIEGALFSTLVIFDGGSIGLPAMDIILHPHPEDKDYAIENGENYFDDEMIINDDCELHGEFCNWGKK
jgi:hypothetical protein